MAAFSTSTACCDLYLWPAKSIQVFSTASGYSLVHRDCSSPSSDTVVTRSSRWTNGWIVSLKPMPLPTMLADMHFNVQFNTRCAVPKQMVKEFWLKAASHVVPLLRIERFILLHNTIDDLMIHFAAYVTAKTPSAFKRAAQCPKISPSHGQISTPI